MRRKFFRLLAAFCLAACLSRAAGASDLDTQMEQFLQEYGLNEQNFSICYVNTVTGEEYRWNDERFMAAGSTFKLPLNLYYYELERDGALTPDSRVGGVRLADCHYQTLVWSDNDIAIDMLYNLGSFRTYKTLMLRYFTMPAERITSAYYTDNNYCTSMMLDALQYLYERSDEFPELLACMKQAQPDSYFRRDVTEYEIAHKYGNFEGAVNDVGIVYAPQPFLLAAYTQNLPDGQTVLAAVCRTLTDYTVSQYEASLPGPEPDPMPEPLSEAAPVFAPAALDDPAEPAEPTAPTAPTTPSEPVEQAVHDNLWWMILIACSIFLLADVLVLLAMKKDSPERFWKRYEKKRRK